MSILSSTVPKSRKPSTSTELSHKNRYIGSFLIIAFTILVAGVITQINTSTEKNWSKVQATMTGHRVSRNISFSRTQTHTDPLLTYTYNYSYEGQPHSGEFSSYVKDRAVVDNESEAEMRWYFYHYTDAQSPSDEFTVLVNPNNSGESILPGRSTMKTRLIGSIIFLGGGVGILVFLSRMQKRKK